MPYFAIRSWIQLTVFSRWNLNQTKSPLLRLPAEIRNRIYELVLGSKTIVIDFKPYHVNNSGVVERTFNYTPTTYRGHVNPFPARSISKSLFTTTKLTLMNSVCRQLYHETEILPFKLNCWAFEKYLTMMNFLFVDKQLMRKQRAAIKELLVTDQLPGGNLLDVMDGVQKVSLVGIATSAAPARRGRYHVVEVDGERSLEHDMLGRGG
jgi:hypothetical protein